MSGNLKLEDKVEIRGKIRVVTGLHIGGSREGARIGGVDNEMIKTRDGKPYIPGSSLKGKLRCLIERKYGITKVGQTKVEDTEIPEGKEICELFGYVASDKNEDAKPTSIIVRDAFLSEEFEDKEPKELIELKTENKIDRIKGTAEHPRTSERVVPGVSFDVEIIVNVYSGQDRSKLLETLKSSLELLEKDYLGGSGSRGYGKVDVSDLLNAVNEKLGQSAKNE